MRQTWSILLLVTTLLFAGCSASVVSPPPVPPGEPPALQVPLALPDEKPAAPVPPDMAVLTERLRTYTDSLDGTWGVHVIDLASRQTADVNGDLIFPMASTFKLPMVMYILHLIDQGKADLEERLTYREEEPAVLAIAQITRIAVEFEQSLH